MAIPPKLYVKGEAEASLSKLKDLMLVHLFLVESSFSRHEGRGSVEATILVL